MGALDTIVSVAISIDSKFPDKAGFGVPLLAYYHTKNADVMREYTDPSELLLDGFTVNDWCYKLMQKMWGVDIHPPKMVLGRRVLPFTQTFDLTPVDTTEGQVYTFVVTEPDGVITTITITCGASETVATIVDDIVTGFGAITSVATATDNATKATIAMAAGVLIDVAFGAMNPKDVLKFDDVTVDPGITADLASFYAQSPGSWYCLLLDSQGTAEVAAAAAWIEANEKIASFSVTDSDTIDGAVSNDLTSTLKGLSYVGCHVNYMQSSIMGGMAHVHAAVMLPTDPGSSTWAHKVLKGVTPDPIIPGHESQVLTKGGNVYRTVGGIGNTFQGISPGGEYLDVTRFKHFLKARIQEAVYALFINNPKIGFSDSGIQLLVAAVRSVLLSQVSTEARPLGFNRDTKPQVFFPAAADVLAADKANRTLPGITFTGTLEGAIHTTGIAGKLSL